MNRRWINQIILFTKYKFKNYVRSKYQNFHNLYVKDELYKNAKKLLNKDDIELIEFASGRGGDIPRWKIWF